GGEELREGLAGVSDPARGESDDDSEDDESEHVLGGQDLREIIDDYGLDQLLADGADLLDVLRFLHLDLHSLGGVEETEGGDHDDGGDDSRDGEDTEHGAHDLAQAGRGGHAGNGR